MTQAYDKLKALLAELFQFDREDLDFGIYRIMNHKRNEVSKFLDEDLLPQVKKAFSEYRAGDDVQVREDLTRLEKTLKDAGVTAEASPKYMALKEKLAETKDLSTLENEVYSDLYKFFRRYYKSGDFLSLRRYKPGVYALPYEGEEVKLHWANADQYYVKTAENFRNYRFRLGDGSRVNFKLVAATSERDNNKAANGKERRFVLRDGQPVEERDGELYVCFEYRPHPDKQADLTARAVETVFEHAPGEWKARLAEPAPTPSNGDRTVLEKHLAEYTAKNTFDYFVHKDLGGFLRRELDFFLKNEVLHIDDLDTDNEKRVGQYLSKLKVIKRIGYKIVAFLAQIEDFQKKLFLKKKFVVSSDYCLTLDNVPEELYEEIAANKAQYDEWEKLFSISEIEANLENGGGDSRSIEWLKANPHLVLDTRFFGHTFKDKLLASIEDLDEKTDGLLVNSENFQALNLLQAHYRERVKCIYIDPPYNTGGDGFLYKDSYRHSSWLAMMEDRLHMSRRMLDEGGVVYSSVDGNELLNLCNLLNVRFGADNHLGNITWRNVRDNNPTRIAIEHEYVTCYAKDASVTAPVWKSQYSSSKELLLNHYSTLREQGLPEGTIQKEYQQFIRDNAAIVGELERYKFVDAEGPYTGSESVHNPHPNGYDYEILHPETGKPMRKPANGYRFPEGTMRREYMDQGRLLYGPDENRIVKIKLYLKDHLDTLRSVLALDGRLGAYRLSSLFGKGKKVFDNPKPVELLERLVSFATEKDATILDFFAGSGTTGHALIDLNQKYGGSRKYVLVEMGEYFDTVLKPRILKVIYSKDWKDGEPTSRDSGVSHIFKYMTLESYEDTLNNLSLRRTEIQDDLIGSNPALREDYALSYMLDFETKGSPSLLNLDAFEDPYSYELNITNGDETRPVCVDLVETFNYLLGLTVSRTYSADGFRVVEGKNPEGERVLVIWRNTRAESNEDLDAFFDARGFGKNGLLDRVYANGDNTLANLKEEGDGWKVHLIEEEFGRLMFEAEGV